MGPTTQKTLTKPQRLIVQRARDYVLTSTRGRTQTTEVHLQADRKFNRRSRLSIVRALWKGINFSDEEANVDGLEKHGPKKTGTWGTE